MKYKYSSENSNLLYSNISICYIKVVKYQIKYSLSRRAIRGSKKISGYDVIFVQDTLKYTKRWIQAKCKSVKQGIEENPGCKHPHVVLLCNMNERERENVSKIVHSLFKLLPFEHRIDYITSMNAK